MKSALVLLAAACLAACEVNLNSEGIVLRETKTFSVTEVPDVQLETFEGAIEVHSWDRHEVEVEIEKRAMEQSLVDQMKVTVEQQGNRIIIKVIAPPRGEDFDGVKIGAHYSPSARLRVALPRKSTLTAVSLEGSINVEDIDGKITLTSNDGSVRGTRLAGELVVRSGDGSIRIDGAAGKLDLETDDGSITVEARPSAFRARTSDGTIRLEVEPDSVMAEDWDVQTAEGAVVLTLPSDFNAVLDAETRDGVVRARSRNIEEPTPSGDGAAPHTETTDREERQRTLHATLGSGGKTLRVRTGDGTIRIE